MKKKSVNYLTLFTKLMSMNEPVWQRHASPFSVWTRVLTGLPVLLSSVWSIQLLGIYSILPLSLAMLWMWLNPRVFPAPSNTNNWASKVTFGERIWINRKNCPIPKHHQNWAVSLSLLTGVSFCIAIVGAYNNLIFPTLCAGLVAWLGKMWLCDRMVWLYEDMKDATPEYHSWLKDDPK